MLPESRSQSGSAGVKTTTGATQGAKKEVLCGGTQSHGGDTQLEDTDTGEAA